MGHVASDPAIRMTVAYPDDDPELAEVVRLELRLHEPAVRRSEAACLELIDPDFREIGASGRVWNRDSVMAMMRDEDYEAPLMDECRGHDSPRRSSW